MPAAADPAPAGRAGGSGEARTVAMTDLFPFYDRYLALPAASRDGFALRYQLRMRDPGAPARAVLIRAGQRTPLSVGAEGTLTPPADIAVLRATQVEFSGGRASVRMNIVPVVPLGERIEASAIRNSLADFDAARRTAGPAALAVPRFRGVAFSGVRSGFAVMADGRQVPLPLDETGKPVFRPDDRAMRGAVAVGFPGLPAQASFSRE